MPLLCNCSWLALAAGHAVHCEMVRGFHRPQVCHPSQEHSFLCDMQAFVLGLDMQAFVLRSPKCTSLG